MIIRVRSSIPQRSKLGRADRGLYHGKERRYGNMISYSNRKTRRTWDPNVQTKTFYSELLDQKLKINVTTKALRCIDKMGGLDNYLLFSKPKYLDSQLAQDLRNLLIRKWEHVNKKPFDRRLLLYEAKIRDLVVHGMMPAEEGRQKLESAVKNNRKMRKFLQEHPDAKIFDDLVAPSQAQSAAAAAAEAVQRQAAM